jgi:hypothetical protein
MIDSEKVYQSTTNPESDETVWYKKRMPCPKALQAPDKNVIINCFFLYK